MKILALDSSAVSVSAAVWDSGRITASEFMNAGLTHSQTLMPMIERVCEQAGVSCSDIDLFAVTNGPGSFTGIRIGVSTVKGLAFPDNADCIGVSTLETAAMNMLGTDCVAVSVMDARCAQVYTASFDVRGNNVRRITEDTAMSIDELGEQIKKYKKPVYFVGDGANLCYEKLKDKSDNVNVLQGDSIYQNAENVCRLAFKYADKAYKGEYLVPFYLRPSQAERELKAKRGIKNDSNRS